MNQPISIGRYGVAYLCWAITVALAFVVLLVWRSSAMIALGVTDWDRYVEHALNQFGFLFLAIAGLSVIIFAENFYRTGVQKNLLFRRFFLITLLELLLLALAHFVQWIGGVMLNIAFSPLVFMIELILCVVVFMLYRRAGERASQ